MSNQSKRIENIRSFGFYLCIILSINIAFLFWELGIAWIIVIVMIAVTVEHTIECYIIERIK